MERKVIFSYFSSPQNEKHSKCLFLFQNEITKMIKSRLVIHHNKSCVVDIIFMVLNFLCMAPDVCFIYNS